MRSSTIQGFILSLIDLLNRLAPLIIGLTVLVFIWGLLRMILSNAEQAKKEGKQIIVFGIVALFVMVSIWGLVNVLSRTFKFGDVSRPPQGPGVPRFK